MDNAAPIVEEETVDPNGDANALAEQQKAASAQQEQQREAADVQRRMNMLNPDEGAEGADAAAANGSMDVEKFLDAIRNVDLTSDDPYASMTQLLTAIGVDPAKMEELKTKLAESGNGAPSADGENSTFVAAVTPEDVESRAMDIATQTMQDNPEFQAAVTDKITAITEGLDAKLAAGELTDVEYSMERFAQTKAVFEEMTPMIEQIQNDSRIYAAKELGVDLATVYPELAAAAGEPEKPEQPEQGQEVAANGADADAPPENENANNTPEVPPEETASVGGAGNDEVSVPSGEEIAGDPYVQSPTGGPVTYDVASAVNGEPVMNFDQGTVEFGNGADMQGVFGGAANPDPVQVAMVNPYLDVINSLGGYQSPASTADNNSFGTMMA